MCPYCCLPPSPRRPSRTHPPLCSTIPSVVRALGGQVAVSSINTLLQRPQQHCTVSSLLVMYGLPRLLIGSIIAHELMHAYLRMRHVAGLPLQVCACACARACCGCRHVWLQWTGHARRSTAVKHAAAGLFPRAPRWRRACAS